MYQILKSLQAVENKTLTESAESSMNEIADADLDAAALAKHKARLAREKNRMSLSMPKPGGGPRKSDVPAAARAARDEAPLSLTDLDEADGKEIDYDSLEVDGIDYRDAPDFTDAYFGDGYYTDGTQLSDQDLDRLSDDRDLVSQYVDKVVYEGQAVTEEKVDYVKGPDSGAEVVINGKPAVVLGEIPAQRGAATYYAVQYKGQQYPNRKDGGKTFDQVNVNLFYRELPSYKKSKQQAEGNEFSGKLARARSIGAENFEVDGKKYAVKESKKAKPDFADIDGDGDKKEPMKKAAADKKKGAASKPASSAGLTAGQKKLPAGLQKAIAKKKTVKESGELSEDYSDFFDKKMAYQKIGATVDGSDSDYTVTFRDGKRKRYVTKDGRRQVTTLSPVDRQDDVDDEGNVVKRGRGRPAGPAKAPERTTAKAYKHKGIRKVKEDDIDPADRGEYDREGDMALNQLHQIADAAEELHSILNAEENLPEWVQSKITKAVDYLDTVRDYMKAKKSQYQTRGEEAIAEKAVSRSQQQAAGAALAAKRGEGKAVGASKEMMKMSTKELEKFAGTKHKGLPDKKKTEAKDDAVEETTTSGSVAAGGDKPAKANSMFGKGVYEGAIAESYNRKLSSVLTESMSINVSTDDQGQRSITVTATEADADQLAELLTMSGLVGSANTDGMQTDVPCAECGGHSGLHEAECPHSVNEEYANEPNAQYGDMEMLLQTMSGGVNGPKRQVNPNNPGDNPLAMKRLGQKGSGQVDLGSMAEGIEKETQTRLWDLYKRFQ